MQMFTGDRKQASFIPYDVIEAKIKVEKYSK